eukprot:gnl/TRDRNA2_/TRDRNA2_183787_c0_seq1.p1 gnl/TRDRNA2_/TRDRNA2_183787_c0~~gnl/TRDRNA2_/TRDRNA2_183787_c0_seq1.p1  ORF type:complete len:300 (-),score=36.65 gnl/TRDRNA2_/TRDRNA2_183787_c0_seq1:36-935(-)
MYLMLRSCACFLVLYYWADAGEVATAEGYCDRAEDDELALLSLQPTGSRLRGVDSPGPSSSFKKDMLERIWMPFGYDTTQSTAEQQFPPEDTDGGRRALVYSGRALFRGPYSLRRPQDHDFALYLDKNSPLWGKENITADDMIRNMRGFELLLHVCGLPRWFPRQILRPFARDLALSVVSTLDGFTETDLDNALELIFKDPGSSNFNAVVGIRNDEFGSLFHSNGQNLGRWDNVDFIKKVTHTILGEDSIFTGLREAVFSNLARGGPSSGPGGLQNMGTPASVNDRLVHTDRALTRSLT